MSGLASLSHRAAAVAIGGGILLSACGTPPTDTSAATSSAATVVTTSSAASAAPNDLASGSTERTLTAGAATMVVKYWSDLPIGEWTVQASKPLSLSVTATIGSDPKIGIYLARFSAATVVVDAGGKVLAGPTDVVDQATVQPGYAMQKPYSYANTFISPAMTSTASAMTITLRYEVLIQTTRTALTYAKQTVVDTLTVPLS